MTNKNKEKKEITRDGMQKLEKELEERRTTIKRDLQNELDEELRAGDISENTSYYRVQEEIASNDKRIQELEEIIANAVVVDKKNGDTDAGIGSTVTISRDGTEISYQIVGATEADPTENKISIDSPIGAALANAEEGKSVTVQTPAGPIKYDIIKVE